MSKRNAALWGVLLIVALLLGCKPKPPQTSGNLAGEGPAGPAPNATVRMDLRIDPTPPRTDADAVFLVKLKDVAGAPLDGANVHTSLVMKEMDMGKNEFPLTDKGNGSYEGTGRFTMAGDWRVVVTAKMGSNEAVQRFDAHAVMPAPK